MDADHIDTYVHEDHDQRCHHIEADHSSHSPRGRFRIHRERRLLRVVGTGRGTQSEDVESADICSPGQCRSSQSLEGRARLWFGSAFGWTAMAGVRRRVVTLQILTFCYSEVTHQPGYTRQNVQRLY